VPPTLRKYADGPLGRPVSPTARADAGPGIEIRGLAKRFGAGGVVVAALSDVHLDIRDGEFLCIVGPSGCGKTSLLRILADLEQPTNGSITIKIDAGSRPLRSMVFQGNGVFPWMRVIDNAAYGLTARRVPRREAQARAAVCLRKLGIEQFREAYPRQLSGGMLQRVNLARAFVNDPAILLMDEPFGALDEQTKILAYRDLLGLWEASRKTVIFITHSIDEAIILGDRVAVMTRRPGRIKTVFPIDLPRPRAVLDLHSDAEFTRVRKEIWTALRDEVLSTNSLDGGVASE
jgi:NitT/TauT family transport system ATP-binding protein